MVSGVQVQKAISPGSGVSTEAEVQPRSETRLAVNYGERAEIRELIDRLRAGLPNANKVPDRGIIALATASIAHGLDPWLGEIWVIYNEKKDELSLMAGIKGQRKAARRQMPEREHIYTEFKAVSADDWARYRLDDKDQNSREVELAELCFLRRSDTTAAYVSELERMVRITGSYQEAKDMLGPAPVWVGVGIVRLGEYSRMERTQLVRKRAESDAIKQAFDLPFASPGSASEGITVGVAEGEDGNGSGNGYGLPDDIVGQAKPEIRVEIARPHVAEMVRREIQQQVDRNPVAQAKEASQKQRGYVAALLDEAFADSPTQDKDRHAVQGWLIGKASVKDLSAAEASALIDRLVDAEGSLSDVGRVEMHNVLRQALIEQGQSDMFEDEPTEAEQEYLEQAELFDPGPQKGEAA